METISLWWQYGFLLFSMALPWKGYGKAMEQSEAIFEEAKEQKVTANSTFSITVREVKGNNNQYHPIRPSITKMDQFTVVEQHNYMLQHLGNHWTAAQDIGYSLPQQIGTTDGLTAYNPYFQHPQDIAYYCTPISKAYTYFNIVLANLGSFIFDGCYSQRLQDNWHAGIHIYGAMTENEWPHLKEAKKIVDGFPQFDLFTSLNLLDSAYTLFTSFSTATYTTQESGGIKNSTVQAMPLYSPSPKERYNATRKLLDEKYMATRLAFGKKDLGIHHKDKRRQLYLYHQYMFSFPIQVYHELHYSCKHTLCDVASATGIEPNFIAYIDKNDQHKSLPDIQSVLKFNKLGNEIGMKGKSKLYCLSYGGYYRLEKSYFYHDWSQHTQTTYTLRPGKILNKKITDIEHYLGGHTRWNPSQDSELHIDGEYLATPRSYYKLNIAYTHSGLSLSYNRMKHKVPYIVQQGYYPYRPPFASTRYTAPSAQKFKTTYAYTLPGVEINPMLSLIRIHHHIYYRPLEKPDHNAKEQYHHGIAQPIQAMDAINLFSWGSYLNFYFSYFHIDNCLIFLRDVSATKTKVFKGHLPAYSYTGRYYFAHQPCKKKMDIEIGVNLHFKASYYADSYDVVQQQFYRQKQFPVQGKPIVDVFGNYRVNNLKISIKFSCINDLFGKEDKKFYFSTPFYPGQKPAADIGIHWSFFD